MKSLEVSGAVRPIYGSLGVKRLIKKNVVAVKALNYRAYKLIYNTTSKIQFNTVFWVRIHTNFSRTLRNIPFSRYRFMHTNCSRTPTAHYLYNTVISSFLPGPKNSGILALSENIQN